MSEHTAGSRPRRRRHRPRRFPLALGILATCLGLAALFIAAYHLWGVSAEVEREQERITAELERRWADPVTVVPPAAAPSLSDLAGPGEDPVVSPNLTSRQSSVPAVAGNGQPIVRMYIPKLGLHWTVVEGVTARDLRSGPGHYPATQGPGEPGNFAVAGHRIPSVFWDLDRLTTGDTIVIRTATEWLVYQVYAGLVVDPHDVWVLDPNPRDLGAAPTSSVLTLTTCTPKGSNKQRLVVQAELTSRSSSADPPPAKLR